MRGIGDILSEPLGLPGMPAVLVNPGVAVETRSVFAALAAARAGAPAPPPGEAPSDPLAAWHAVRTPDALIRALADGRNDLEPPAIAIAPQVAEALALLRADRTCRLARMSGSGATCFALFDDDRAAAAAAGRLRVARPAWWIEATTIG
jgi:4-diphosphocytidyl-2-C-methyl-D-erythritol kinase